MNGYGIICAFGIVVLLAAASVQCSKIHKRMTDDEIANIFHTTRDKLPKYVVAPVWHNIFKPTNQKLRVKFSAFGKVMDTYLQPSDGQLMGANTPVWLAFTKPDGIVEYKKMPEGIVGRMTSKFFTDHANFSAVTVNQVKGENPSFYGMVGNLIIRPLPKRLQGKARTTRNSEAPNASITMLDTHDHVIIKSTLVTEPEGLERQVRDASQSGDGIDVSRVKRSNQEIIYPSVLVQTDFKGSKTTLNEADYYDEIIYQLAFWNGVDLLFRHVNDPKIRIRIAGIIIGLDRNASPYMRKDVANVAERVEEIKKYWFKTSQRVDFPPEAYHIFMAITDTAISKDGSGGSGSKRFCVPASDDKYHSVGVAYDKGSFAGIGSAAFALGSIFGLDVDREDDDECGGLNGFIMSHISINSPNNIEWSPCSLKALTASLRRSSMNCADKPAEFYPPGDPLQRLLPGDIASPDKQCQGRGFAWACDPDPDMCTQMQCYYTDWKALIYGRWCKDAGPAIEGTLCAPGRKCIDGVCQCMTADCMYCRADPATNP